MLTYVICRTTVLCPHQKSKLVPFWYIVDSFSQLALGRHVGLGHFPLLNAHIFVLLLEVLEETAGENRKFCQEVFISLLVVCILLL